MAKYKRKAMEVDAWLVSKENYKRFAKNLPELTIFNGWFVVRDKNNEWSVHKPESFNKNFNPIKPKTELALPVPQDWLLVIPVIGGNGKFYVTQELVDLWQETYPNLNIMMELQKMIVWFDANPSRKKTNKGIKRAVVNWLNRSQDSNRGATQNGSTTGTNAVLNLINKEEGE